jgi:hypothetical protein
MPETWKEGVVSVSVSVFVLPSPSAYFSHLNSQGSPGQGQY